ESTNDVERPVVVRRRCDAYTVGAQRLESPVENGARRLGHQPLPGAIGAEPIPQLAAEVKVRELLETHDAEHAPAGAIAHGKPTRPSCVPVIGARLRVAVARVLVHVERNPGEPRLELAARRLYAMPEIARIGRIDRCEGQSMRLDGVEPKFGARRN